MTLANLGSSSTSARPSTRFPSPLSSIVGSVSVDAYSSIMQFTLSGPCRRLAFQTRYTNPGAIAKDPDGNLWFTGFLIHGNSPKIGDYIVRVLSAAPSTLTFTAPGQTQLVTISEANHTGTWTASSSDTTIATVTPTSQSNVFQVMSVGVGSTSIIITDQDQNSIGVPVVVQ
jgi:hypothetical protein